MRNYIFELLCLSCLGFFPYQAGAQDIGRRLSENAVITAVERYNEGEIPEAVAILKDILKKDPDNDAAHYYLGLSEFISGDNDAAEDELKKAVSIDSSNFWYCYRLAMVYSVTGKQELTLAMFEDLIRDFPKKYDLYYNMIDLYLSQDQGGKALEILDQIEAVFGKNEMTAIARFDILRKLDRTDEGYESLEKFNEEYSSAQILSLLGDRQLTLYNDSLAVSLYDEALGLSPGFVPATLGKAEAYRMTRKYDDFFAVLDGFVRDDSVPVESKCQYLDVLAGSSGPTFLKIFMPQMDSLVTTCETMYPRDSTVNLMAGKYYYSTGRNDLAKACFRTNMEEFPASLSAAANYVEILMYMHEWDSLVKESMAAYGKFPGETAFLEYASLGEYNLGNYGKVIDICRRVLSDAQGDSLKTLNAYTTMGDMYFKTGEERKAFSSYDKALAINPDYAPVLNNYAYFLSLGKKKLKKACVMSKKTIDQQPDNATYLDTYGWILYLMGRPEEAKPVFKNAVMLYGGKENAVILDHYAEVLYALGEYDLAFLYWNQAKSKNNGEIADLEERISARKSAARKK